MKRFILCLAALLAVFLPLAYSLISPSQVYAYSSGAVTSCKKTTGGGTPGDLKSCEQGYDGAKAGKTQKQACPDSMGQGSRDPAALSQPICFAGWTDGKAASSPTPQAPQNPSSAAQQACKSAEAGSQSAIAACEIGYDGAQAGKTQDAVCGPLGNASSRGATVGTTDECGVGWDLAKGIAPPGSGSRGSQPTAAATDACNSYVVNSENDACTAGYAAQVAGKKEDDVCNSTKYPDSGDLNACKHGWETGQSDAANADKQLGCDAQLSSPLSWIICPLVNYVLVPFVNFADNLITNQLNVKTNAIFCDSGATCQAYYQAWQSFRDIALGLMVIAGLIIVISQALGLEILDAYTIRKVLPRLLIAAIGITLSWPLMKFLIQLSDDLGFGVRHLIYAPFSSLSDSLDLSFGGGIAGLFGAYSTAGAAAAVAVPAFIVAGGPGALLAYAGTAVLAVFVAILVLILRQVAIILLMLISPIAIIAYILPNTQRIYRLWWESFSRALLMFPLIAAFIATGRVFSAISIHNGGTLNSVIGFAAYFAPYFMIPLTFRMAGASVSALGNFVQSRAQGGFQGLTKFRANRRAAGRKRIQDQNAFRGAPPGSLKGRLNRAYQTASLFNPDEISANPRRWREEARTLRERRNLSSALKGLDESPAFQPIKGDDDASQAAIYGRGTREDARRYLEAKGFSREEVERKLTHIDLAKRQMGEPAFRQAAILSAVAASTAYAQDPITGEHEGIGKLLSDIDVASNGDAQTRAQLIGQVKQRAQQAGRMDLSAPFSEMYAQTQLIGRAQNDTERRAAIHNATDVLTDTVIDVEGPGYVLGGKGRAVEYMLPALQRRVQRAAQNLEAVHLGQGVMIDDGQGGQRPMTEAEANREVKQVLASTAALHDIAGQVSPEKARLIANGLLGQNIPGFKKTVLEEIDDFRGDDEFFQMRNDFQHRYERQSSDAAMQQQQQMQQQGALGQQPPIPPPPGAIPN